MINKFGVQNYRGFKNMTEFNIRPLTIFIGPNNSGKSSISKLMMLLKNGLTQLDFHNGNHNLENFDRILNWDSDDKTIVVRLEIESVLLDFNFVDLYYENGGLVKLVRHNKIENLLEVKINEEKDTSSSNIIQNWKKGLRKDPYLVNRSFEINYNLEALIRTILDFRILVLHDVEDLIEGYADVVLKRAPILDFLKKDIKTLKEWRKDFHKNYELLYEKIQALTGNYCIYDVKIDGEDILPTDDRFQDIVDIQFSLFRNNHQTGSASSILEEIEEYISLIHNEYRGEFYDALLQRFDNSEIEIKENLLYNIIFKSSDQLFPFNFLKGYDFLGIQKNPFEKIFEVGIHRASSKRVLSKSDDSDMAEVMDKFVTEDKNKIQFEIISQVLNILGIPGFLYVEKVENSITIPYIKRDDGKDVNLSDLGFGYSQIITMVLKIIQNRESDSIFIIEEPEANLHPNFQSKLADIFALLLSWKYKFIIETHSEYLIRKLQYLVAKKEVDTKNCIIYYFNIDENVSDKEPKVKSIEITENGNLTDNFGPGFFDEATRLQFELLKLNRNQSN